MNFSNYKFTLDMHTAQSQVSLPVVLNDTARKFYISLSDGGKSYHIADGCLALIRINRPTGTYVEHFCSIEDNTNIVYDLSQFGNTAIIPGVHDCEVTLYGLEDEVITTARFTMVVSERVVNSDDVEIKDENWTMLDEIGNEEARRQAAESARNKAEKLRDEAEQGRAKAEFERETNTAIAIEAANAVAAELLRKAEDGEFNGKDGKDGKDGEDGYTPVKGVDYFDGEDGKDGKNGVDGRDGVDGRTPVKGVDYFDGKDGKNGDVGPVGPVGPAGVYVGTEAPTDGQTVWIDTDEEPEDVPEESGTKIDVVANVGQVIAVKAVGADSKPTEFEAVDLPKVTTPDFSANEGEDGYIKNRTHYIDDKGIVHKLSNKYIDADWMATSVEQGGTPIFYADLVFAENTNIAYLSEYGGGFKVDPGFEFDVYWGGVKYVCPLKEKGGEPYIGNGSLALGAEDTGEPFCLYGVFLAPDLIYYVKKNTTTAETISLYVTVKSEVFYNKLPEEFLPEGVVKSVNGSKPDEKGNVTVEIPEGGGGSGIDVTAEVGQTIVVKEVDGNGKPTKWEAAYVNNIPKFTIDEIAAMGIEFYNVVAGADVVIVEGRTSKSSSSYSLTYILTKVKYGSADSDLQKAYPRYEGFACYKGCVYELDISVTGTLDNPSFRYYVSDYDTVAVINATLSNGMVPTWEHGGWSFKVPEIPEKLEPLVLSLPSEYLVDGVTLPISIDVLYNASVKLSKFPYAVLNTSSEDVTEYIPVLYLSTNTQTFVTTLKCISPTTGDLITITCTPAESLED